MQSWVNGAALLIGGAATDFDPIGVAPSIALLLGGAVMMVIGAVWLDGTPGEQRDGATTEWTVPMKVNVPADSAGNADEGKVP